MYAKTVVLFCLQAFFSQAIASCLSGINPALGRNLGNGIGIGLGSPAFGLGAPAVGLGAGCGRGVGLGAGAALANGGGFTVTSSSPIAPSGVQVVSEYVIEGPVNVGGQLPVLSAVHVDGQVPTGGTAGTSYSCGNGNVGIVSEIGAPVTNVAAANAAGFANAGLAAANLANAGLANGIGLGAAGLGLARAGCNGLY